MKIAIYLNVADKHVGGGYSYARQVIHYFSTYEGKHEFVFVTEKGLKNQLFDGLQVRNHIEFDASTCENNVENKLNITGVQRALRLLEFVKYRLKRSFVLPFIEILEQRRRIIRNQERKIAFENFCVNQNIEFVYYPQAEICLSVDVPFVATVWDLGHHTRPYFAEIAGKGEFERRENVLTTILPRAYKIVRESEAGKQELIDIYGTREGKILVVPQFPGEVVTTVISRDFESITLKEYDLEKDMYIFYPAQFWPHKNHINLLKAIAALKQKGIFIKLVLTGSDKGNFKKVEQVVESLNLEKQVVNMGFIDDNKLHVLYKNALALVYPSMLGPTNMPIVEALALGCPVLCSNHTGHQEQAGDAALYFDPSSVSEMENSIEKVFRDEKLCRTLVEKGLSIYVEKRSIQDSFCQLLVAFDQFEKISVNL